MSGQCAKRRKTPALALAGVPAIDSLPPDLLDAIFGFLDVGTLCTACLVCAQFRGVASRRMCSVQLSVQTLRSRPETTLNNFPNLSRVTVFGVKEADLPMLAQSPVAAAVTHLQAVDYLRPVPRRTRTAAGSPLLPFPNLTSLTVACTSNRAFSFPQTLRELALEKCHFLSIQTLNLVAGLTNLTCLRIDGSYMRKPFEAVTALTALQRLEMCSELSVIPFLGELSQLTHLQFKVRGASPSDLTHLVPLTRLHTLVHLGVKDIGASLEQHVISSAATLTGLRSLDLDPYSEPQSTAFETVPMLPFSRLTALRLGHLGSTTSYLHRFNVERLQDLSLSHGLVLDRDGVAALKRATGLTQLELDCSARVDIDDELGIALSRMSRLRALSLCETIHWQAPACSKAIGLLTELTKLQMTGGRHTTSADAELCLGLKKLRVLWVDVPFCAWAPPEGMTLETFCAIAKLPELRKFGLFGNVRFSGRDLTDTVGARLNAYRHDRGWPALDLMINGPLSSRDH